MVKDSVFFCYDPAATEWLPDPIPAPFEANYGFTRLCSTPGGAVAWQDGLWRVDVARRRWDPLPLAGARLPSVGNEAHGMTHDSTRDRLLLFSDASHGDVMAYDFKTGQATLLNPTGKDMVKGMPCREVVYMPDCDAAFVAARVQDAQGRWRWPIYDCAKNVWRTASLAGDEPLGGNYSVSLGLMYDARRRIVWTMDGNDGTVYALRLDIKTADLQSPE